MTIYYDPWANTKPQEQYYVNAAGEKNGTYKHYDKQGLVDREYNFLNGEENGLCTDYATYSGKRSVAKKMTYKNGVLDGPYADYHETGFAMTEGNYKAGKKEGKWVTINPLMISNLPKECAFYKETKFYRLGEESDTLTGRVTISYYPSGKPYIQKDLKQGRLDGEYKKYGCGGNLIISESYKDNVADGPWKLYSIKDTGKLLGGGIYTQGKRTGKWKYFFDEKWNEVSEESYFAYYREITFDNEGKPTDDIARDYWIDGTKQFEGYFLSVSPDLFKGVAKYYNKDGSLQAERDFSTGKVKQYYPNGKEKEIFTADRMGKQGEYKAFHENGNLKEEGSYLDNKENGEWKFYHEEGRPKSIIQYKNGNQGNAVQYNKDGEIIAIRNGMFNTFNAEQSRELVLCGMVKCIVDGTPYKFNPFPEEFTSYERKPDAGNALYYALHPNESEYPSSQMNYEKQPDPPYLKKYKAQLEQANSYYTSYRSEMASNDLTNYHRAVKVLEEILAVK